MDGNSLLADCRAAPNSFTHGFCMGFTTAVASALSHGPVASYRACIPDGVTYGQLMEVVTLYITNNPQLRHTGAASLSASALQDAFPC